MTDSPVLGVSACLFRVDHVLLVERGRAPFEGLLSLPGGRVEFGERLDEAIRREVDEETGLRVEAFAFHCLHEAIEPGVHVVIAVHRATEALRPGIEPVAADDARSVRFLPVAELRSLGQRGQLTPGLAEIVESAHHAHLLGL